MSGFITELPYSDKDAGSWVFQLANIFLLASYGMVDVMYLRIFLALSTLFFVVTHSASCVPLLDKRITDRRWRMLQRIGGWNHVELVPVCRQSVQASPHCALANAGASPRCWPMGS